MADELATLWALISGVSILLSAVGLLLMVEGLTRHRSVSTGASRHVATASGAVLGAVAAGIIRPGETTAADRWVEMAVAVLVATIVAAGLAERATFVAHTVTGLVVGGLALPVLAWSRESAGILASISIDGQDFLDAGAASIFGVGGWMATVGLLVIGPRRGRIGADGTMREIPGKSMGAASIGAALFLSTVVGLSTRPSNTWTNAVFDTAPYFVLAGAVGTVAAAVVGWQRTGSVETPTAVHGVIAGVVSAAGAPLDLTVLRAVIFATVGTLLALAVIELLPRVTVDDPVGVVGVFGAAGLWGTLAVGITNAEQLSAQLVGALILLAGSVVVAGVLFGALRLTRVLRLPPDVEIVGLDR